MAKRIILIVPDGADSLLSILDQYMRGKRTFFFVLSLFSFLYLSLRMGG
jgi:hypothetical protein